MKRSKNPKYHSKLKVDLNPTPADFNNMLSPYPANVKNMVSS
jgi:hypothetical protein